MKIIYTLIFIFTITAVSHGDEIYLKNGKVIKGEVIQITKRIVEYDPDGPRAFDVLKKEDVFKIVDTEDKIIYQSPDKLFTRKGKVIHCRILKVAKDAVHISVGKIRIKKKISRDKIERIEFSDGRIISENGEEIQDGNKKSKNETRDFHDSIIRIGGFFGFGSPVGGIFNREERVFNAYTLDLFQAYVLPREYEINSSLIKGGCEVDVMAPSIRFKQRRSFDFTGIKFAFRIRYGYEKIKNIILDNDFSYDKSFDSELFSGKLMDYHYWTAGAVINVVFSTRRKNYNVILNAYCMAGQILNGKLTATPALRNATMLTLLYAGAYPGITPYLSIVDATHTKYFNSTSFSGYTVRAGLGPLITVNKYFPITIGINATYAYANIKIDRSMPVYYSSKLKVAHHEWGGEVSAGFHFNFQKKY